jgi:AAA ATPase domain
VVNPVSTPLPPKDAVSPENDQSLPRPATSFIGRERDVAHLVELFSRDDVRLVTLTGPGGVGKTRLALHVAERVRAQDEDVWFVSLAAIHDPALVPVTIRESFFFRLPLITLGGRNPVSVWSQKSPPASRLVGSPSSCRSGAALLHPSCLIGPAYT